MTTIQDKLDGLDHWRDRIHAADQSDEWKDRAFATTMRHEAHLHGLAADLKLLTPRDVAYGHAHASDFFSEDEQWAILWQHVRNLDLGEFKTKLIEAASVADGENLDRLWLAFPGLVNGIRRWRGESGFADRIRSLLDESGE